MERECFKMKSTMPRLFGSDQLVFTVKTRVIGVSFAKLKEEKLLIG